MAEIEFDDVVKRYPDGFEAVKHMNLEITDGELLVLVGPSGCGKSTALRMIAGLEDISEGDLKIGGEVVNDLAPKDRDIAMVFQNYALYPHMSVRDNMGFALKLRKEKPEEINRLRDRGREDPRPRGASRPQARQPLRRPAPARGHGPRDRARAEGLPHGRAALQPRRQAARRDARRGLAPAAAPRHDHGLRDPRPDRGHDPRPPRRRHARRHPAAGRRAEGALREPAQPLRGGVHRLAGHELLLGPHGQRLDQDADGRDPARRRAAPAPGASRIGRQGGHRRHPPRGLRGRAVRPRGPRRLRVRRRRSSSPSRWARRSTRTSTSRAATRSRPRSCASSRRTPGPPTCPAAPAATRSRASTPTAPSRRESAASCG